MYKNVDRPGWIDYFLGLAFVMAERSEDSDTKHGCILVDQNNHIVGTGYNSLPRGTSNGSWSNTRPLKYKYMIHAEENALLNKTVLSNNLTAYVTAKPCFSCLTRLWNGNINRVYYVESNYHFAGWEDEVEDFNKFLEDVGMIVHPVIPFLGWLKRPLERLNLVD
jgi:dCMP deaminase